VLTHPGRGTANKTGGPWPATATWCSRSDHDTTAVSSVGSGSSSLPDLNGTAGSGLVGLRDRVESIGGHLNIDSCPATGNTLRAALPAYPRPSMSDGLRVVLAEDNYLCARAPAACSRTPAEIAVIATAGDAPQLLRVVERHTPDVVVTDIRMPPSHSTEGIAAAHTVRGRFPGVGVVVLSQYADGGYALELFRDGTAGLAYLLKERVGDSGAGEVADAMLALG
jgi:CheY-like chemotaxis protein